MKQLSNNTKANLESLLGITLPMLDSLDVPSEIAFVDKQLKTKVSFSKKRDRRKIGRGNPLLARKRFRTMDAVNRGLDNIK